MSTKGCKLPPRRKPSCKHCGGPKVFKPTKVSKLGTMRLVGRCPPCNTKIEQLRVRSPEMKRRNKNTMLLRTYGISIDQYETMLESQNHKCFLCKRHKSEFKKGLAVDHDHSTGQVRKLLCGDCNQSIGLIKENFDVALAVAKYIQEYKGII